VKRHGDKIDMTKKMNEALFNRWVDDRRFAIKNKLIGYKECKEDLQAVEYAIAFKDKKAMEKEIVDFKAELNRLSGGERAREWIIVGKKGALNEFESRLKENISRNDHAKFTIIGMMNLYNLISETKKELEHD
jgi:wobble nucleotide-excising tRNase